MSHVLRWILLMPGILGSWVTVFFVFGDYHRRLTNRCLSSSPPECFESWYLFQVQYLPAIGAAVSAIVVVLLAYAIAPVSKVKVARLTFIVGAAIAILCGALALDAKNWSYVIAASGAVAAGMLTVAFLSRWRFARTP